MDFREMAETRENEASELGDGEIWMSIVSKFVLLDMPIDSKIEMMLLATGNEREIVEKALQASVKNNLIQESQANEILEKI